MRSFPQDNSECFQQVILPALLLIYPQSLQLYIAISHKLKHLDYSNCGYPVNHWKTRNYLEVHSVLGFFSMQTLTEKEWKFLKPGRQLCGFTA